MSYLCHVFVGGKNLLSLVGFIQRERCRAGASSEIHYEGSLSLNFIPFSNFYQLYWLVS